MIWTARFGGDTVYNCVQCPYCLSISTWECYLQPGFADFEDVKCPVCGHNVCELRADLGKTLADFFNVKNDLHGESFLSTIEEGWK